MTAPTWLAPLGFVLVLSAQTPAPTTSEPETEASPAAPAPSRNDGPSPYVREVWTYTVAGRTDPLHPPSTLRDGSNLPELTISGILLNTVEPKLSRAAFRLASGERAIVSVGDTIPPFVVVAIEADRVQIRYPQLGGVSHRWIERAKTSPRK